jgi:hypothetical protein
MPGGRDELVGCDMGTGYDELVALCFVRNAKTIVSYGPREHIFVESIEQVELAFFILGIAFRKTSKSLRAAGLICIDSLCRQDRRNRRIHIRSCDLPHASEPGAEKYDGENALDCEPEPEKDFHKEPVHGHFGPNSEKPGVNVGPHILAFSAQSILHSNVYNTPSRSYRSGANSIQILTHA